MISLRRPVTIVAALATATLVAGCGGGPDTGTDEVGGDTAEPALEASPTTGVEAGTGDTTIDGDAPEILQFTSPLVGGGELDAATLATKPTAFWFWSPT